MSSLQIFLAGLNGNEIGNAVEPYVPQSNNIFDISPAPLNIHGNSRGNMTNMRGMNNMNNRGHIRGGNRGGIQNARGFPGGFRGSRGRGMPRGAGTPRGRGGF